VLGGVLVRGPILRDVTVNLVALRALRGGDAEATQALQRYLFALALVAATQEIDLFLREGCHLRYAGDDVWRLVPRRGPAQPVDLAGARAARDAFVASAVAPMRARWSVTAKVEDVAAARAVAGLADHLYQLGRGIDLAWAWADILEAAAWEHLLSTYPGRVHRPTPGGREGLALACPQPGSLESLRARHRAMGERFGTRRRGPVRSTVWTQPPPARFARVVYDGAPFRRVYELRGAAAADAPFVPHDPERVTALVVAIRDGAVARLTTALPELRDTVRRSLVGRRPDGSDAAPPGARVRLVPLPSAGHAQADGRIRRVLVEVPAACPLEASDVDWACSGLVLAEPALGLDVTLQPAADGASWEARYATAASVWRTLTPAALPFVHPGSEGDAPRSAPRVDGGIPGRARAAAAVLQALRHAGVRARVASLRVQREPFFPGGLRAEAYASHALAGADSGMWKWPSRNRWPDPWCWATAASWGWG
jgi:CRISPR-associated protein Csb2